MKNLACPSIAKYRNIAADRQRGVPTADREWGGAFEIPKFTNWQRVQLRVIASRGDPEAEDEGERWDHVSVSLPNRCPTWEEMEFVKRLFFNDRETAFQLHVPVSKHISNHAFCLHIWRPCGREIPMPSADLVGVVMEDRTATAIGKIMP